MYSALDVANKLLDFADEEDEPLTPMKLQKLVFLAHGWHLAIHKRPLVSEYAEAWEWGPVFGSLYHELKMFGREPVKGRITDWGVLTPGEVSYYDADVYKIPETDTETIEFIKVVWDAYKEYTGSQLSNWLHIDGSPWHQVWNREGGVRRNEIIDDDIIKDYYENYAKENQ